MDSSAQNGGQGVLVASAQFFSVRPWQQLLRFTNPFRVLQGQDVPENLEKCRGYMQKAAAAGAKLVVFPENSNRERTYFKDGKPSRELCYELCEDLSGAFVSGIQEEAKKLGMYVAVGVDLKGEASPIVYIASILVGPDGAIVGVHQKHILWDYEYTLFEAGSKPYEVFPTKELGVIGLLLCADGILPETARALSLLGAQVLANSLNSRGPDELRMHIPLRAIENGVWHVASNTVGNPNSVGLLWPWTGGSQIVAPDGSVLAQGSEDNEEMVMATIYPELALLKNGCIAPSVGAEASTGTDIFAWRRPELYTVMTTPVEDCDVQSKYEMYGAVAEGWDEAETNEGRAVETRVAMMQHSWLHTTAYTQWEALRQIDLASRRQAHVGVFPQLYCFEQSEINSWTSPAAAEKAAAYSEQVLQSHCAAAKKGSVFVCLTLVEKDGGCLYHTAYLINSNGTVESFYRKAHLTNEEARWATPGAALSSVVNTSFGRFAMMIGEEMWIPEVPRCLALAGAETILHPCSWDRAEQPLIAAVERCSENRVHVISVTRLDTPAGVGSQVVMAGEFVGGEPIALMRYPTAQWMRHGVEEQLVVALKRREANCKMMGYHLDVLRKRHPQCYASLTTPAPASSGAAQCLQARREQLVPPSKGLEGWLGEAMRTTGVSPMPMAAVPQRPFPKADVEPLKIVLASGAGGTFGVDDITVAAADCLGFWEREGLDVSWIPARGGVNAMKEVLQGNAQVSYGTWMPLAYHNEKVMRDATAGSRYVALGSMATGLAQNLLVRADKIQTVEQLKGAKWAIDGVGALSHNMAKLTVQGLGIAEDTIDWVTAGPPPQRIAKLLAGEVDCALVRVEEATVLAREHAGELTCLLACAQLSKLAPVQPHGVLGCSLDFAESHPEECARLVRGLVHASRAMHDDYEAFKATVKKNVAVNVRNEEIRVIWEHEHNGGGFAVNGGLSRRHWAKQFQVFGIDSLQPEDMLMRSYMRAAHQEIGLHDADFDKVDYS
jgi:predicted amidohydrolase/ABC-type nitrate/sulfonate/bicarbonate transport system substrate-binding protein